MFCIVDVGIFPDKVVFVHEDNDGNIIMKAVVLVKMLLGSIMEKRRRKKKKSNVWLSEDSYQTMEFLISCRGVEKILISRFTSCPLTFQRTKMT